MHDDPEPKTIKKGIYRHSKSGKKYEVISAALHTETNEQLVVYRPLYVSNFELFARPYEMFVETVEIDSKTKPRFEYLGSDDSATM